MANGTSCVIVSPDTVKVFLWVGAKLLSGRVLDSRPYRRHCVVILSKTHYPCLVARETRPDRNEKKKVDWDLKNQIKQMVKVLQSYLFYIHICWYLKLDQW